MEGLDAPAIMVDFFSMAVVILLVFILSTASAVAALGIDAYLRCRDKVLFEVSVFAASQWLFTFALLMDTLAQAGSVSGEFYWIPAASSMVLGLYAMGWSLFSLSGALVGVDTPLWRAGAHIGGVILAGSRAALVVMQVSDPLIYNLPIWTYGLLCVAGQFLFRHRCPKIDTFFGLFSGLSCTLILVQVLISWWLGLPNDRTVAMALSTAFYLLGVSLLLLYLIRIFAPFPSLKPLSVAELDWSPYGLSKRELEVAPLLAQGLTNPQVAESLFISEKTVEKHVTSIFRKCRVHTRLALLTRLTETSAQRARDRS